MTTGTDRVQVSGMTDDRSRARSGLWLGLGAYVAWGVLPVYFRAVGRVPATEIVAHRVVWSLLFLVLLAALASDGGPSPPRSAIPG
jgi:EamA domain-containing membrane protein RarD